MQPYSYDATGRPGTTYTTVLTDTAIALKTLYAPESGKVPVAVTLSSLANNAMFAFTATPSPTLGHILYEGQLMRFSNPAALGKMKLINALNGTVCTISITYEYMI